MTQLPTERTNSKGKKEVIKDMLYPHLKNATLKAERVDPNNPETHAMRDELDRREKEYAEQQAAAGDSVDAAHSAATAHRQE